MKKLLIILAFSSGVFADNLYLANNNVSCGRYTLNDNSNLDNVTNYCTVLQSNKIKGGGTRLRIKTINNGVVICRFYGGQLETCREAD